jgi:hypothetical protein
MRYYIFVLCFLIISSCSSTSEPEIDNSLSGIVIDHDNNPVSDALIEIEYRYNLALPKISGISKQVAYTNIKFSIPETDHVLLWISNYSVDDTIKVLKEDTLKAGYYSFIWDGIDSDQKLCVSNVYEYHLKYQSENSTDYFMILNEYHSIDTSMALNFYALSNSKGTFTIPYNDLAISHDLEFTLIDDFGDLVGVTKLSPVINIWAIHTRHGKAASYNIELSKEGSNYIEIHY